MIVKFSYSSWSPNLIPRGVVWTNIPAGFMGEVVTKLIDFKIVESIGWQSEKKEYKIQIGKESEEKKC